MPAFCIRDRASPASPQRTPSCTKRPIANRLRRGVASLVAIATTTALGLAIEARASVSVQQVKSPSGVTAWLMEDHSVPLITVQFAFRGGDSQDAAGKQGTALFLSGTIDEGAGPLSMTDFQNTIARLGIKVSFSSSNDWWSGTLATLRENRDKAADLARTMLMEPRVEQSSIDRLRGIYLSSLAQRQKSPTSIAVDRLLKIAYPGHPYGTPQGGSKESLNAITRDDIMDYRRRVLARDNLKVSVAGAINAAELAILLDRVFGGLPERAELATVAKVEPQGAGRVEVVDIDVPQSVALFQLPGIAFADPDYMTARIMMAILASGGFESRLMKEIRVKRGLAYGVSASLSSSLAAHTLIGTVSSRNEAIAEAMSVVKAELKRMAADGPTATELDETKSNMIGAYALNFDTIGSMASLMQSTQLSGLNTNYFANRSAMIAQVTAEDVKRVAARLLDPDRMLLVVAGKPQALVTTTAR